MDKPRFVFGERLRVGARPGHTSGGVAAARAGETAPMLLPHAAAVDTTDQIDQGFRIELVGLLQIAATISEV